MSVPDWYGKRPVRSVPLTDLGIKYMALPRPDARGYHHAPLASPGLEDEVRLRRYIRATRVPRYILSAAGLAGLVVWWWYGWL